MVVGNGEDLKLSDVTRSVLWTDHSGSEEGAETGGRKTH